MSLNYAEAFDADTNEMIEMYHAQDPGTAKHVVAAFVLEGLEPPQALGFTAKQSQIVQAFYAKYDPNGSREQWAEVEKETAGL